MRKIRVSESAYQKIMHQCEQRGVSIHQVLDELTENMPVMVAAPKEGVTVW